MEYQEIYIPSLKKKVLTKILNQEESDTFIDQMKEFGGFYKEGSNCFFYIQTTTGMTFGPETDELMHDYYKNLDSITERLNFSENNKKNLENLADSCVDIADAESGSGSLKEFKKNIGNFMGLFTNFILKSSGDDYKKNQKKINSLVKNMTSDIIKLWDLFRYSTFINDFPLYYEFNKSLEERRKQKEITTLVKRVDQGKIKTQEKTKKDESIQEHKVRSLEKKLEKTVKGQDEVLRGIADTLYLRTSGISERLPVIYVFLGPTGVGKTHLTRELNNYLFDGKKKLFEMTGSNFYDKHMISKLIGSPAGYVGYEDESGLAKHVEENPGSSIILFDEFEKAHDSIWHLILTYADTGMVQDSKNNDLDLRDTIMILTGNVGNMDFSKAIGIVTSDQSKQLEKHVKASLEKLLRPEIRGRVNVVYFNKLSKEAKNEILKLEIGYAMERLKNRRKIKLKVSNKLKDYLLEQGFDEKKGARGLKNMLRKELFVPLGRFVVENNLKNTEVKSDYKKQVKFYRASQNKSQS